MSEPQTLAMEPETIEIKGSVLKLLGLLGYGVALTGAGVAIVTGLVPAGASSADRIIALVIGWLCVIFFGACTVVALWRLARVGATVITLTAEGIRDTRVTAGIVPWQAIRSVSTWQYASTPILVLGIDPHVERTLTLTLIARHTRSANRSLGADGLCIATQDLTIGHDTLRDLCIARIEAAQASAHGLGGRGPPAVAD